jgi:hypothetical protein
MQKELAGVRIKIDTYMKDKKKELSKPIDVFESQCKELIKLIEDAEKPIKEGVSIFDNQKREEKRQEALKVITEVAQAHQLNEKYASQLTVLDKYMNLTASKREVLADVEQRAFFLKEQQTAEEERLEIIKDAIENVNKNISIKLSLIDFQRLIDSGVSTKEIIQDINSRAERIKTKEVEAEELRKKKEALAKEAEAERLRIAALPKDEVITESASTITTPDPVKEAPIYHHNQHEQPVYFIEIRVTGTKADIAQLGHYLKEQGYKYKVIDKGLV